MEVSLWTQLHQWETQGTYQLQGPESIPSYRQYAHAFEALPSDLGPLMSFFSERMGLAWLIREQPSPFPLAVRQLE